MQMCHIVDKSGFVPVDQWVPGPGDEIFQNVKGEIILPIAEYFSCADNQVDLFCMNSKRSYNSDKTRGHICQYLNYFEKFYDHDRELLMYIYRIKTLIDYNKLYSVDAFMDDINRYIIWNDSLSRKIVHFVDDNYNMKLSNNGGKTPNLQFNNSHAKVLYEISLIMNMYIPLATHYMYMHMIKRSEAVQDFMLKLFDKCVVRYETERGIYIYNKIYETALSVVNKSKNPDKRLWEKNLIRGNDPTTHTKDSVNDIILQIMPKYSYDNSIINFNYYSNRKSLQYKITDIAYEFGFVRLSSSERDADQNSEYDKYEARLNKKDEALALQNKVAAEQAVKQISMLYGPFDDAEIAHYKNVLTDNGGQLITRLTSQLLGYVFYKNLGDPVTWKNIPNSTEYIKLMIAAKRMLLSMGMIYLPYVISSKIKRSSARKVINKANTSMITHTELFNQVNAKYNNPKIIQQWFDILGTIKSSSFIIIDWDNASNCPAPHDGYELPIISDALDEEMLRFAVMI